MSEENNIKFSGTFPLDRDGFFRRECPNCGLEFKTKADPSSLASQLQRNFQRINSSNNDIRMDDNDQSKLSEMTCPYCKHKSTIDKFFTPEFIRYFEQLIYIDYVYPQIQDLFSGFNSSSGNSMLSIKVTSSSNTTIPPRPLSGPEPPNMITIKFLCCGELIKVYKDSQQLHECPFCQEQIKIE